MSKATITNTTKGQIFDFVSSAFLEGSNAIVTLSDDTNITVDSSNVRVVNKKVDKKDIDFVYWGENNDLPTRILDRVYKNAYVAPNVNFNILMTYGSGIMPVTKTIDAKTGKIVIKPVLDNAEVNEFLEHNNIDRWLYNASGDMNVFYNAWAELIPNRERTKIVRMRHLEASYSRLSKINKKTGNIDWLGYSTGWVNHENDDDFSIIPLLDDESPVYDIKMRAGRIPNNDGKTVDVKEPKWACPINIPTPGRFYYQKPWWWCIIESGWYDFAVAIPKFKKALLKNMMALKYHVQISNEFWIDWYKEDNADTDAKKKVSRANFFKKLNEFLSGEEKAGSGFISKMKIGNDGKSIPYISITPIESDHKGGEYLEDSEEVSNIIAFAFGNHSSLIGSAPGKSKTINGTEARELFIIKQAMMAPVRNALLTPLYVVKAFNKWPDDLYFTIPDIELTTLDQGTGSKKVIS
jgi:hypothetical protein